MSTLFRHEALPYAGDDSFVPSCEGVVRDGLADGERVMVLAGTRRLDDVRDSLGDDADEVTFVATDEHGRNPARITAMLHSFQATGDGRRATGVHETAFVGRSPAALAEAQFADFLLNSPTLSTWPLSVVCLYDTTLLDATTLHAVQSSHAVIRGDGSNPTYDPDLAARTFAGNLDASPSGATRFSVEVGQLTLMRDTVRSTALRLGVTPDRIDDLVLAANEIVTNSLRHGGGRADVALWAADGSAVLEVADTGVIADPMTGRLAPPPSSTSGRGLWLANLLCDLVQVRSSERGTVVRMHVEE